MKQQRQDGFILLSILITTTFIMVIGVISLQLIGTNLQSVKKERYTINAQFAADAGLDDAVRQINLDNTWTGSGGEVTLATSTDFKSTYQTNIVDGSDEFQKFINVTAHAYVPASATTPKSTRKYQVELRGITSGSYSIVSGVGGMNMLNNSKILGGAVFVNGLLNMSGSSQIGLSILPVSVKVADQACPVPADNNYPRVCVPADNPAQPISMTVNARIYGEVQATNQTDGTHMSSPGLVAGTPSPAPLPQYDRQAQVNAVANTVTGSSAGCSSGTKIWQANTKITGDVTISGACLVTVEGNVWITGNLLIRNSGTLIVKLGVTTPPVIMVDGSSGVTMRNGATLLANLNLQPVGFRILTYASSKSCSVAETNACDVTGLDLYNSKDLKTISIENSASAAQTEFYAYWSKVSIGNSGNIGALVGQTVELDNSAAITFGTEVSGFTGPVGWVVKSYKRTF